MSSGNAYQERVSEALDAAIADNTPTGKLEDAEIQRLVALSNEAGYERSERIPVKTVESFEPRSLVSIAMAAQRRRESEMRTAVAAGAVIEDTDEQGETAAREGDIAASGDTGHQPTADGGDADGTDADTPNAASPGAAGDPALGEAVSDGVDAGDNNADDEVGESAPSSTSQVDFEAGRAEGLEEGRRVGFAEGEAKGMEEGRAAGRAEASAQLERAIQAFESASERLTELTKIDSSALGSSVNDAILRLASERAGHAIAELPDSFADRIEALLATIRTVSGQPSIRLNPGDLTSIQPLAETREKLRHCNFVADPALASGDLSVMIGTIGIDDIIVPQPAGQDAVLADGVSDVGDGPDDSDGPDDGDGPDGGDGPDAGETGTVDDGPDGAPSETDMSADTDMTAVAEASDTDQEERDD